MSSKNIEALLKDFSRPVMATSVQAMGRIGLDRIFKNFEIFCLHYSKEVGHIRENGVKIFCYDENYKRAAQEKRNPTTILKKKQVQKIIQKRIDQSGGQKPILILYTSNQTIERLATQNNWTLAANPYRLFKKTRAKTYFKELLIKAGLEKLLPREIIKLKNLSAEKLFQKYPNGFVIQDLIRSGGGGTMFIFTENDFEKALKKAKKELEAKPNSRFLVCRFIKGCSPSVTGCVTKHGILQTSPQLQLIDIKELYPEFKGSGVFLGHDWSTASQISDLAKHAMYQITEKIGNILKEEGYKGIFGLDFMLDAANDQVFPIELNPRLLGVFPTSTLIQLNQNEIPLMAFHVLEFADIDYKIDAAELNKIYAMPKQGAHSFITNPFKPCIIKGAINPGVNKVINGKLKFRRPGYLLSHLKDKEEFLITEYSYAPNASITEDDGPFRIMRFITLGPVSSKMGKEFNEFGKKIVRAIYRELKIEKTNLPNT